ncbi:MAG: Ig-like domain-containing protein [Thermoplasmatota archaeon]
MKRILLIALLLLTVTVAASEEDDAYFLVGENPTADSMWANQTHVVVGRLDGVVSAIDRTTGDIEWEWVATDLPDPRVLDLQFLDGTFYVAISDLTRPGPEGIVALDGAGAELWRFFDDFEDEVYRLAYDPIAPWNQERLFVGMAGGHLAAVNLTTQALEEGGAGPLVFSPDTKDSANGKCSIVESASGIYALEVYNDTLWASRNFGGEDKQGQCFQPLLTSESNVLYRLQASTFSTPDAGYSQELQLGAYDPIDDERNAYPSVWDIWIDPFQTDTIEHVYLVGAMSGTIGFVEYQQVPVACADVCLVQTSTVSFSTDDDTLFGGPSTFSGPGTIGAAVTGTEDRLFIGTWQNDTSGMNNPALSDSAHLFKLGKDLDSELPGTWRHTDPQGWTRIGRATGAGDIVSLAIVDGEDTLIVGHGGTVPPYPSVGSIGHHYGASIIEVPMGLGPVGIQMLPHGGEIITNTFPVAFRVDSPNPAALSAEFQVRNNGPWETLPGLELGTISPDAYRVSNNVDFRSLPDGPGYEVRLVTQGADGAFIDRIQNPFTIDRTAPTVFNPLPAHGTVLQTCQPVISVEGFEETTGIDTFASGVYIDGRAYPYVNFQLDQEGNIVGAVLDMSQLDPDQGDNQQPLTGLPPGCLAEGRHVVRVEFVDFANNFGFVEWAIYVDTGIRSPILSPSTQTWLTGSAKPLTAQFFEDISIVDSSLGVPGFIQELPPSSSNPDGSRVIAKANSLPDGPLTWHLEVEDAVGNRFEQSYVFQVDQTKPAWTNPVPGPGSITGDVRPAITAELQELGSGIKTSSLRLFLDGQEVQSGVVREADRIRFQTPLALTEGEHTVRVLATDVAGNVGERSWAFQVDANAPTASFTASLPGQQDALSMGDVVHLDVIAADFSGIASVQVDVRGLDKNGTATVDLAHIGNGRYVGEYKVTVPQSRTVQLTATVTDDTGKSSKLTREVVVDNLPPSTFMPALPGTVGDRVVVQWQDVLVTGTGTPTRTYEVQVKRGAENWTTLADGFKGTSWTYVHRELDDQTVLFRVRATDGAGNVEQAFSNAVETKMKGNPFGTPVLPTRITDAANLTIQVPVVPEHLTSSTNVSVELRKAGKLVGVYELKRAGQLFMVELGALPAGTYEYTFMRSLDGYDLEGEPRTFTVEGVPLQTQEVEKDAPATPVLAILAGLAILGILRRRPSC